MREFFQRNHIICLATASGGQPYSTPLFYHFVEADVLFCFLSSADTRHAGEADRNEHVSAAVYAPARTVADLQGAQILGTASWQPAGQVTTAPAFLGYLQSYPEAQEARTGLDEGALQFWTLRADWIKFTDNRRGFGHKEIWSRS